VLLNVWPWQNQGGQFQQRINFALGRQIGNALPQILHMIGQDIGEHVFDLFGGFVG